MTNILPQNAQPGLLRICPYCQKWHAIEFVRSETHERFGKVETYSCKKCGKEVTFCDDRPGSGI